MPFIFKYAVDFLNTPSNWLNLADPASTIVTTATALLVGCKYLSVYIFKNGTCLPGSYLIWFGLISVLLPFNTF